MTTETERTTGAGVAQATLPACLTRTSADDREEAGRAFDEMRREANLREAQIRNESEAFKAALAAIQRREAEAVRALARSLTSARGGFAALNDAAVYAAGVADDEARSQCDDLTLAQRATLLDAARALVRLALEVAR